MFYQSWVPEQGSLPGYVASPWFEPGPRFQVPLRGFPVGAGIEAYVECKQNGARRALVSGNPRENWALRLVELPGGWCEGPVRVAERTESKRDYVGIGTPYSAGKVDRLLRSAPAYAWRHLLAFAPLASLFVACYVIACACRASRAHRIAWAATGVATIGYLAFLAAALGMPRFGAVAGAVCVLMACVLWWQRVIRLPPGLWRGVGACYLLSLACALLVAGANIGAAQWDANELFRPALWSTDHLLPGLVAEGIYNRQPLGSILGGGWQVADRPPLQAGILLVVRPLWAWGVRAEAMPALIPELYVIGGIALQCCALVLAYAFIRRVFRVAADPRAVAFAAIAVLVSPFFVFNAIYPWPKLLSAGFALLGTAVLLWLPTGSTTRERAWAIALAGVLFGYALLAHAGVAIGLIALPLLLRTIGGRWRLPEVLACAMLAALVWAPWSAWQHAVGQAGTALTKFALAGDFDFAHPTRPVWQAVLDRYSGLSLSQWASTRLFALLTLAGAAIPQPIAFMVDRPADTLGALRITDFVFVLPALRFLLLALAGAALFAGINAARRMDLLAPRTLALAATGVAGLLANALVLWSVHIQHTQSYLSLLLVYGAAAGALLMLPRRIMYVVGGLQIAYVAIVWLAHPLLDRSPDVASIVVAALALALVVATVATPRGKRPSEPRLAIGSAA